MPSTQDYLQLAIEETPRFEGAADLAPTRVSTNKVYLPVQTGRAVPGVVPLDRSDEVRGIEGAVPQLVDGYEPAGAIAMRAYANPLTWLLAVAGFNPTHTAGDGVITDPDAVAIPAGAHRWVFTKRGGLTAKTLQMLLSYVDEGFFLKAQGYGVQGWTLDAAGAFTAELVGLVAGRVADPNLTPAYDTQAIPHLRRGDLTLTWLAGTAETDDFSIAGSNPLTRRHTMSLDPPSFFPDKLDHGDERVYIRGSIPKAAIDPDDFDALMDLSTFAAKARWQSPHTIAASGYPYSMWLQMPSCQYVSGEPDELSNKRRLGATFDWFAAWDEAAGYDAKITLVNAVSAIETLTP